MSEPDPPQRMTDVTTSEVYRFGSELLVELVGVGERGDVATITVEFDRVDDGSDRVTPREELSPDHEPHVRTALSEAGYSLSDSE